MKKRVLSLLALAAAFALTACQGSAESDYSQPLDSPGVAPYEMSEETKFVLDVYDLNRSTILRYRVPEGAFGMTVNSYVLQDGEWVENGLGGVYGIRREDSTGVMALSLLEDGRIGLRITSDGASYTMSTSDTLPLNDMMSSSLGFLTNPAEAEVGDVIPVALACYDTGSSMQGHALEDFFTPEVFEGMEIVQAVTVEFTEELTD